MKLKDDEHTVVNRERPQDKIVGNYISIHGSVEEGFSLLLYHRKLLGNVSTNWLKPIHFNTLEELLKKLNTIKLF